METGAHEPDTGLRRIAQAPAASHDAMSPSDPSADHSPAEQHGLRPPGYPHDEIVGMGYFPDELDPLAPPSPTRGDLRISGGDDLS